MNKGKVLAAIALAIAAASYSAPRAHALPPDPDIWMHWYEATHKNAVTENSPKVEADKGPAKDGILNSILKFFGLKANDGSSKQAK
jgi:hypothetical protein